MKLSFLPNHNQLFDTEIVKYIERNSAEYPWLKTLRLSAFSDYNKQPLPTRKAEHWKYNDMFFLSQSEYKFSPKLDTTKNNGSLNYLLSDTITIVIIDGHYNAELSNHVLDSNIIVTHFIDSNQSQQKLILNAFEKAQQNKNSLVTLNSAVNSDGLLLEIPSDTKIDRPICIHYLMTKPEQNSLSTGQVIVHGQINSQFTLVEKFESTENSFENLSIQQTIIHLEENSHCEHIRLNLESENSKHVGRVLSLLEKHSKLNSFYFSEGSQLNKTDIDVYHQGEYSKSQITGIYLPSNNRTIDYHTNVEHRVANCTSRKVFRGIIADSSKATFNGKIHIFKYAQKSDAQLSNKNLLLTNLAEVNTKPELEIYADDVICAHGATVAKIDDTAVYYLQTRGISKQLAKKMLSIGFINELLEKINNKAIVQLLKQQIQTCLADIK